jgi:hypothetical protein
MPFPISLTQEEYEALVELARQGTMDDAGASIPEKARALSAYLVIIEKKNGISRYAVWVQWQEADSPLPPGTLFPKKWPPEMREYMALTSRPIAKTDVIAMLKNRSRNPVNVLVTKDPGATVGWQNLDTFFK